MDTYSLERADPQPCAFTRRERTLPISQVQIHTTRGPGVPEDRQLAATVNWFADCDPFPTGNDRGGWGGSADFVVGPDAAQGGRIRILEFRNALGGWEATYGSWSAGYGSRGSAREYGAAEVGVAIEIAQQRPGDPIDPRSIDATAWLCREVILPRVVALGHPPIPATRITNWTQTRARPVPRGFIGHEDLENGRKLGKSDPGPMFPWTEFLRLVAAAPRTTNELTASAPTITREPPAGAMALSAALS